MHNIVLINNSRASWPSEILRDSQTICFRMLLSFFKTGTIVAMAHKTCSTIGLGCSLTKINEILLINLSLSKVKRALFCLVTNSHEFVCFTKHVNVFFKLLSGNSLP